MVEHLYRLLYTKEAQKDARRIGRDSRLKARVKKLLVILSEDPLSSLCKAFVGKYKGAYSRRINRQHRLVYQVNELTKTVKVLRMWAHYGD
ncbi:MAG TPA: Txe/YoeB family addiction module toxin [Opitutae bacterium]|nr:Txe/YoeB family addiction module toxin [Opitutae bacterium]|tara:strand:- start:171 stop:443 length:273 start_codon:yes stop_codon:yes gene_type:complete